MPGSISKPYRSLARLLKLWFRFGMQVRYTASSVQCQGSVGVFIGLVVTRANGHRSGRFPFGPRPGRMHKRSCMITRDFVAHCSASVDAVLATANTARTRATGRYLLCATSFFTSHLAFDNLSNLK